MTLSVVINTKNVAETIEDTLASIRSIADEIVIVDMNSTDKTLKLAEKYTDSIYTFKKDVGYVEPARNFALSKAKSDWILVLDADEEIGGELKRLISKIVDDKVEENLKADCYFLPRKNIIFHEWMQHTGWWPDYQLRLFRKGMVTWSDQVHSVPIAEGKVMELPAKEEFAIIHHNYQKPSQFIERLNRYTDIEANSKNDRQKELLASHPLSIFGEEFFRRVFVSQGIEDGLHGMSLSLLQGTYQLVTFLKIWEKEKFVEKRGAKQQNMVALLRFQQDLSYWIADWHVQNTSGWGQFIWKLRRKYKI